MNEGPPKKLSREERLAAKLRENLRRRKAQGKAITRNPDDSATASSTESLPNPPRDS
ncbi:hypothetical protein [Erythrobacter sp.]|uniref:hypothetical protein n=1 Tax=Erythrobacter sp. TaxID=1042 RepID=UPI0025FED849|nr:hypothetical protein [Erythrobacter sp.]